MIPAFVNDKAGTAVKARAALEEVGGFEVRDIPPDEMSDAIRAEVGNKPRRIVIAGGDGTVGMAASQTCGTDVELAVLPGGTLNHFARDHGIPTDLVQAAQVAKDGECAPADVAYVGDHIFLNTASVGAYVSYVRLRERLEKYVGYRVASFLAAIRLFFTVQPITVQLEVNNEARTYSTPLVFIGVGERELKSPEFGSRVAGGKHCLHVLVVRERRAAKLVVVAVEAAMGGLRKVAKTPELDSFMVSACSVKLRARGRHLSVDGEIVRMDSPLQFRLEQDALKIVVPASGSGAATGAEASGNA